MYLNNNCFMSCSLCRTERGHFTDYCEIPRSIMSLKTSSTILDTIHTTSEASVDVDFLRKFVPHPNHL